MTNLQHATVRADDYVLTHKVSFGKVSPGNLDRQGPDFNKQVSSNAALNPSDNLVRKTSRFPAGPTCFYCKKKGHVMAECRALEKKNQRLSQNLLVATQSYSTCVQNDTSSLSSHKISEEVDKSYAPFLSQGTVSLTADSEKIPVSILRDTGATQTLLLETFLINPQLVIVCYYKE